MAVQDPPNERGQLAFQETVTSDPRDALSADPGELARGRTVDRYVILDQIGAGGMGVVYAAYDPRLDRRVALKFLGEGRPDRDQVREQRLVREAQAMARLSHPNVAVVYEVGVIEGRAFVAMEYVDGVDLRAWLGAAPRSLVEILALFIAAGSGLAAAHAAGIVHRDFKPENVLVDRQGRPRVTDFGISRTSRDGGPDTAGAEAARDLAGRSAPGDPSRSLTATGALLGTPLYMAPEQHRGMEADARADQFAFCVALYEAVTGVRPFLAGSSAEMLDAIRARRFAPGSELPRRLRAAVLRGLEPDPRDRWPGMDALLAALAGRPDQRHRWLLAGGLAAGLAGLAWSWLAGSHVVDPCPPARSQVAGIWAPPVREHVRAAFLATRAPRAAAVFERAERALQGRVTSWVAAHRETCQATRVRGVQSEALLDVRMECLERARRQIAALPELWQEQVNIDEAIRAALAAGEIEACRDAVTAVIPPPSDPESARALEDLRRALDRIASLQRAGRSEVALPLARDAVARARKLAYAPILAEALHRGGQAEIDSGDREAGLALLHEAFRAASEAHDDVRAAAAMRLVLYYSALSSDHLAEADALSKVAEATVARVPHGDELAADLLGTQGVVLQQQGKRALARDRLRRALALKEKLYGPNDFRILGVLNNLAAVLIDSESVDEALALNERARTLIEDTLGPEHPLVVTSLQNRALILYERGDYEAASRSAEHGLEIGEKIYPPEHPATVRGLRNLATVRQAQYRDDEARALLERAERIALRAPTPDPWTIVAIDEDLAELALRRGDVAVAHRIMDGLLRKERAGEDQGGRLVRLLTTGAIELHDRRAAAARAAYQEALAISHAQGEDPLEVAAATSGLGAVALLEGKTADAIAQLERATQPIEERPGGGMHPFLVPILTDLGRAHLAAGQPAQAIRVLERAVAIAEADRSSAPTPGARARFALAQALWASRERERALALATAARADLAGRPDSAEVDEWIRVHSRGRAHPRACGTDDCSVRTTSR